VWADIKKGLQLIVTVSPKHDGNGKRNVPTWAVPFYVFGKAKRIPVFSQSLLFIEERKRI
jgi:hypothetical protein